MPAQQADLMTHSQVLNLADNLKAVITDAAWRSKPSWMIAAVKDRTINPDLERWYAARAEPHHRGCRCEPLGIASRPKEVAAVIEEAATHVQ
jgi:hypothetical protein